jgi:ABC-type taurine transport system substrate-binding protein
MTQEIIEMARQVDACYIPRYDIWQLDSESLKAFAKLVAAKEREACAKLIDDIEWKCITDDVDDPSLKEVVKAIRARGEA